MSQTFQEPDLATLKAALTGMVGRKVAVVGDAMVDEYLKGDIERISPEAPVPVLAVREDHFTLGGAANVAKCLVAMGAKVKLVATVGADAAAQTFLAEARSLGIGVEGVVTDRDRPTITKTRVVVENHQVIRLDRERAEPLSPALEKRVITRVQRVCGWADAVIVSDYAKGLMTPGVCRATIRAAGKAPVVVDPKNLPWEKYRGATLIKPNAKETQLFSGEPVGDDANAERLARRMAEALGVRQVLITRGGKGMTLVQAGGKKAAAALHLHPRQREVYDVTGSGDVVAATIALGLAAGLEVRLATWLSNVAAGINVTRFGASTVSNDEILGAVGRRVPEYERKVMTPREAAGFARKLRAQGKKVVFTNGCFDILHLGHVNYLERSRAEGDAMIVGVNTDASVRKLKGPARPLQSEHDRARIIASQACVDAVVLFGEQTPLKLIRAVQPDVLTKGRDYREKKNVVGWEIVEQRGGRVALIDLVQGRSTTDLINKSRG